MPPSVYPSPLFTFRSPCLELNGTHPFPLPIKYSISGTTPIYSSTIPNPKELSQSQTWPSLPRKHSFPLLCPALPAGSSSSPEVSAAAPAGTGVLHSSREPQADDSRTPEQRHLQDHPCHRPPASGCLPRARLRQRPAHQHPADHLRYLPFSFSILHTRTNKRPRNRLHPRPHPRPVHHFQVLESTRARRNPPAPSFPH